MAKVTGKEYTDMLAELSNAGLTQNDVARYLNKKYIGEANDLISQVLAGVSVADILEKVADIDAGAIGKKFENTLLKAFDMVGLSYDKNRGSGAGWDFRPTGAGWKPIIGDKDVNIKISSAKWLFSVSELSTMLPWDAVPADYDFDKAVKKVRQLLIKRGAHKLHFLKPKDKDVQNKIGDAVKAKDGEELVKLLIKRNFKLEPLGRGFEVKISKRNNRIGSITIVKDGKVFGRSERPREPFGVGFRMPASRKMPQTNVAKKGTDVIKRAVEGECIDDLLDEITTSAAVAIRPMPMRKRRKKNEAKTAVPGGAKHSALTPKRNRPDGIRSDYTNPWQVMIRDQGLNLAFNKVESMTAMVLQGQNPHQVIKNMEN